MAEEALQLDEQVDDVTPQSAGAIDVSNVATAEFDPRTGMTGTAIKGLDVNRTKQEHDALSEDTRLAGSSDYDTTQVSGELANNVDVKSWDTFTPDSMESRMAKLLDPEKLNPFVERAGALEEVIANSSGLLSSKQGAGMVSGAMMDKAFNIAKQDQDTESSFGRLQAQADYGIADSEAAGIISGGLNSQEQKNQNINNAFTAALQGLDKSSQERLTAAKAQWDQDFQTAVKQYEGDLELMLNNNQISAAVADSVRSINASMLENYQVSVENLLGDPEFLALGGNAMSTILNNMGKGIQAGISYTVASAGLSSDPQVQFQENLFSNMTWGSTSIPVYSDNSEKTDGSIISPISK